YTREGEDGERQAYAQIVLAAVGRDPVTDFDWMDDAGIDRDGRGFVVTDAMGRTSAPGVWAVGDITPGHALAHRAFEQGIVVAEAIAGCDPRPVDETTVPQIVFSLPEAASVGLTADQARSRADLVDVRETPYPMMGNARMMMSGAAGSLSVVTGAAADRPDVELVLGVHMVAPVASDLIAEAQQLVGNHVPLAQAARLIHPHPTFAETMGEALLKADDRPLHTR
ncbi:MAG TPA: FAD-dependent oxidoreductase, partial [Bifidobacterium pullorum]|nr:FAD-dependent oxidoreductase [Bifidobacterium pullorum]